MNELKVGMTVNHLGHAAIVTMVWTQECVDLVYWDRGSEKWIPVYSSYAFERV